MFGAAAYRHRSVNLSLRFTYEFTDRESCRWGLGKTQTPHSKSARGIPEWATVVNEVLDQLGIDECSVMAHSAGSPYALAFANRYPHRVRGDVCLLAPWVGEGGQLYLSLAWLND